MKAAPHSFVLAAYLPIPKFINVSVPVQATLTTCIYHSCLTIVTEHSQQDAWGGIEIPDPLGHICVCYPTLVSWIADLPEQRLITGVLQNQFLSHRQPLTTSEMDLMIKISLVEITIEHCSIYILLSHRQTQVTSQCSSRCANHLVSSAFTSLFGGNWGCL